MKLYRDLAAYYDEIYRFKNYEKEAGKIKALIARHKKSNGRKLLDVACGTGNHITFLKRKFLVEGIDSSPDMLRVCTEETSRCCLPSWRHVAFQAAIVIRCHNLSLQCHWSSEN